MKHLSGFQFDNTNQPTNPPRSQCMHAYVHVHVQIVDPSPFPGPQLHHCMIHLTARSVYVTQEINGVIVGEKGEGGREKEIQFIAMSSSDRTCASGLIDVFHRDSYCRVIVLLYYCMLCMIHTFFTPNTREHEVIFCGRVDDLDQLD